MWYQIIDFNLSRSQSAKITRWPSWLLFVDGHRDVSPVTVHSQLRLAERIVPTAADWAGRSAKMRKWQKTISRLSSFWLQARSPSVTRNNNFGFSFCKVSLSSQSHKDKITLTLECPGSVSTWNLSGGADRPPPFIPGFSRVNKTFILFMISSLECPGSVSTWEFFRGSKPPPFFPGLSRVNRIECSYSFYASVFFVM